MRNYQTDNHLKVAFVVKGYTTFAAQRSANLSNLWTRESEEYLESFLSSACFKSLLQESHG